MLRRLSTFRRKPRDETQPHQAASESQGSNSISSNVSYPIQAYAIEHRATTHFSTGTANNSDVQLRKNNETEAGPLGLTVVYTPENVRKADIIFIHGLGGTSRWTWSKNRDPDLFWPAKFLPLESDICHARILTFGYNANFRKAGSVSTSILDFAKELLFDLKYAKDDQGDDLDMGSVPLIFVVHSMGGLIFKEAYIEGQNDPEYESIIKAISAIVFLSTPHRGTHLAQTLNRILQSAMITNPKQYISELVKNSFTLERLNEQFRHIAPRLDIISFYETRPTSIGLMNFMVLEKDSSVLGYPGEISRALDADHHNVCKFGSPTDPNYIAVRNVIKSLIGKIESTTKAKKDAPLNKDEMRGLRSLLAISELPFVDYSFFRDQWEPGTCGWILQDENFIEWDRASESVPCFLWLSGGPGTGKSVLSSFIINHLVERGTCCQYFFIRFGDQKKRTLSFLLRSIAFQLAQAVPNFARKLLELIDEGIDYESASPRMIWDRIFKAVLFNMKQELKPFYWIIDGLDEAHDPRATIKLLSDISRYPIPLRILLTGRKISEIGSAFQKVPGSLTVGAVTVEGHLEDLSWYIRQELDMPGSLDFRENVVKRVVEGSQNSFLWVRLAVDRLNSCHRLSDVELAFQELPVGMEALYERMASSIAQNHSQADRALVSSILECVACSFRELSIAELPHGLDEDISEMLDFGRSIIDLCGGFVTIDNSGNVTMIHHTAREYLMSAGEKPFRVDPGTAHERMFLSCMNCLMTANLRDKITQNQTPEFVDYASSWWSPHLISTSPGRTQIIEVLKEFLTSHWVLTWIYVISIIHQQQVLIQASKDLSKYCLKEQQYATKLGDNDVYVTEHELFKSWSIDFVKILGKFGANLRRNPQSIYELIPPFCPRKSSIYQLFGKAEASSITVSGISMEDWDDSLARMSFGYGDYASSIAASGALVGFLTSPGDVFLYDSSTFGEVEVSPIKHGERVYRMELNSTATLLVTYGYRTTKIWETSTGDCKILVNNLESRPRPLSILFTNNSKTLLVGHDDRRIHSLDLNQQFPTWELVVELEEPELEGHFLNSPNYMALNKDATLIAVAYRGHPLSAFEVDGPSHIGHCWRTRKQVARGEVIDAVWHPHDPELLGLYMEGVVFKWRPYEDKAVEMSIGASKLAINGEGNLFATGDSRGIVKVFTTSGFGLVYQVASLDIVLGLTFSPDSQRVYDIRGSYGSFEEQARQSAESGNGTESFTSNPSTGITTLAASPAGRIYSCGTKRGPAHLFDLHQDKVFDTITPKDASSIEQMSWSDDGRVFIIRVAMNGSVLEPAVEIKAEIPMKNITKGPITQLLFQPDSSCLLVFTSNTVHSISLTLFSVWIVHPQDPELIIGFNPQHAEILNWDLIEKQVYVTWLTGSSEVLKVDKVIVTQDKRHILERALHYFETSRLSIPPETASRVEQTNGSRPILPVSIPHEMASKVALPLSFQSEDHLVFLSENLSICSWQIPSGGPVSIIESLRGSRSNIATGASSTSGRQQTSTAPGKRVEELFSLPGDWISRDCLSLCVIWGKEGAFLYPRNGEVAVVKFAALT
ncbi:uncharacterized protein F4807DRAFT_449259 [Annulohypoxylon truncatum]|uniref:uncharacterized protein n=1 Tax=Annulohypoxylon truncatum TaxID=327061 RepID=UPI0020074B97|nr:uncharacterized protein F4807DRAFT_449259 [Annulohypoxylon truncatum]KAI1214673.1 hypothetical protein F4807DRAFT_449259 [Annulohypoxylon truncatum]